MIDEDEVGLKESQKSLDTSTRALSASPLKISFLATENLPKMKLGQVELVRIYC